MKFHEKFKTVINDRIDPEAEAVRQLRGKRGADILIIAPTPNEKEVKYNLPLSCSGYAQIFHRLLLSEAGVDTESHALVMCGSPFNEKPKKASFEPFRKLLEEHAKEFKLVICVGGENFKFYFGDGKKPSMQTLAGGELIYLPEALKGVPMFVFPEVAMLSPKFNNDDNDWKLSIDQEKCTAWVTRLCRRLKKHVKELSL